MVASANATIQGLFNNTRSDPYVYVHRFEVPKIDDASNDELRCKVRVTNAECRDDTKFKLVGYGYDLV